MRRNEKRLKVLVSGASISGPTVAYWLHRYGFDVEIVEWATEPREGGYPIDIRGSAIPVVEKMGLLAELRDRHIDTTSLTLFDRHGCVLTNVEPESVTGGKKGYDIELPRGDLAALIFDATRDFCEYRFGDSIAGLENKAAGVDVRFRSGESALYDFVIGADGPHSNTRALVFGDEAPFLHHLGYCFVGFTLPNLFGMSAQQWVFSTTGRMAALYHVRNSDKVHAFFAFARDSTDVSRLWDPPSRQDLLESVFAGDGWKIPQMLDYLKIADDAFADTVSQVRLPTWSKGRVALIGDAGYAPSFVTGQGTSLSLVGAYVLAGELATHVNHLDAFAAYEKALRPFVAANQGKAEKANWQLIPATEAFECERDRLIRANGLELSASAESKIAIHNGLNVKDYLKQSRPA